MQPRPPISAQLSLKAPHANNDLVLPTNCWLEVNLHLYQLQCLLKNSPIFSAHFSWTKLKILEINLTATHLLIPHHHSTTIQFFMALLLRHSSQSLQTHYDLYWRNLYPLSCALDPIPTPLLFECLDAVIPVLINIVNTSLTTGIYPSIYKTAIVKPLLKSPPLIPMNWKTTDQSPIFHLCRKCLKSLFSHKYSLT